MGLGNGRARGGKRQRFSKMAISDLQGKGEGSRVDLPMSTCLHSLTHSHADLVSDTRNLASFEISAYSRKPTNIPTQNEQQILRKKKTSRKSFDKHTHTELSRALLKIGKGWCEKKTRKQLQLHNWAGAGRREGEQGMDE